MVQSIAVTKQLVSELIVRQVVQVVTYCIVSYCDVIHTPLVLRVSQTNPANRLQAANDPSCTAKHVFWLGKLWTRSMWPSSSYSLKKRSISELTAKLVVQLIANVYVCA